MITGPKRKYPVWRQRSRFTLKFASFGFVSDESENE